MTRDAALLKLIAIEPIMVHELIAATGWGAEETRQRLAALVDRGQVTRWAGAHGEARYTVAGNKHPTAQSPRRAAPRPAPAPMPGRLVHRIC